MKRAKSKCHGDGRKYMTCWKSSVMISSRQWTLCDVRKMALKSGVPIVDGCEPTAKKRTTRKRSSDDNSPLW